MPTTYTYPGVYVEEVPSGVRTITGVSTSDTAFIDVFARGPVGEAKRVTSFADFEREFGGLYDASEASYAIRQFYANGGQIAWVVRVTAGNPGTASADLTSGSPPQAAVTLEAANPGEWGNNLQAVALGVRLPDGSIATDRFNLLVREVRYLPDSAVEVLETETFRNLNLAVGDPNNAGVVVNDRSQLVRIASGGLGGMPTVATPNAAGDAPDDPDAFVP